jgi:hypothetical protein
MSPLLEDMIGIAACVSGPTKVDLFWLQADRGLYHQPGDATQWSSDWEDLGGTFITVPAAVATNSAQLGFPELLDVFAVGADFAMYTKQFAQGGWPAQWLSLRGDFNSGPAVIGRPNGRLDIFAVGSDYAMYHRTRTGLPPNERWSPDWEYLGGSFSSTASVVSRDISSIDVFARGADFTLRHRRNVNGAWSDDWQNLGGSLASPPVAVSWGSRRIDVFAVGSDGALWHRWWDTEIWNDWESLGGSLTQTPSAVAWAPGRLDVFALGLDGAIQQYAFDDHAWRGRQSLGAPLDPPGAEFASGPLAVSLSLDQVNLIGVGSDANLHAKFFDGSAWSPPANFDFVGSGHVWLPTRYRFSADRVQVLETRSAHSDTDAAAASIGAGNWPIQKATQHIADDLGGFDDPQGADLDRLNFTPVTVELCEASVFNYVIVNAGHVDDKVLDDALLKATGSITGDFVTSVSKGIGAGVGAIIAVEVIGTTIVAPVVGSLLGSVVDYLLGKLGTVVFADCDGVVAAEVVALSGRDLYLAATAGPVTVTTTHPGTDSPDGCGSNSLYEVTRTIAFA